MSNNRIRRNIILIWLLNDLKIVHWQFDLATQFVLTTTYMYWSLYFEPSDARGVHHAAPTSRIGNSAAVRCTATDGQKLQFEPINYTVHIQNNAVLFEVKMLRPRPYFLWPYNDLQTVVGWMIENRNFHRTQLPGNVATARYSRFSWHKNISFWSKYAPIIVGGWGSAPRHL